MNPTTTTPAELIPPLGHDEAMLLAVQEYQRLLDLVDQLHGDDWSQPTDCVGWDVKAMLGHVLGMLELDGDAEERSRQLKVASEVAARSGGLRIDAMTALQVKEHAHLSPVQLRDSMHTAVPKALAARAATTAEQRATPYDPELPGERSWTLGYLFDVIHTRDPWLHRVDISRALGRDVVLTAEHDGRVVADVVADWARRHGQWFVLTLAGPAGGRYSVGDAGPHLELDAVEFCRILSGRAPAFGPLATVVPF